MKKIILSATVAFTFLVTTNAFAQQGFGTNQPDKSAAVEIMSTKRGLLIPRVDLKETTDQYPIPVGTAPATSLFVYNKATAGDVTPGFYYWENNKWVRFVSETSEKKVTVSAGENVKVTPATTGNTTDYEVSVKGGSDAGQVLVTKIENGTTSTVWINPNEFVKDVVDAKNGLTYVPAANAGDKNTIKLGGTLTEKTIIATDNGNTLSITGLDNVTAPADTDTILIMDANGVLKTTSKSNLLDAKNLTLGDGLAFEAGIDDNDGVGAVLKATKIEIDDNSVTAVKLDAKGQTEGHVATVNNDGTVTYQAITPGSLTDKKTLTTDGVIVIGADSDATAITAAESVLADVKLNIGKDKITADHIATGAVTSDEILNGTILPEDMASGGNSKVLVTAADGTVSWIDQSNLGNKDSYTGIGAINITANGTSTNGINYDVSVATATGTTLGVVKEAATPTVNINATGELAVNLTNTVLTGDVTGPLNATKVEAIQGKAVSATPPTATNNVLVYDNANQEWVPTELTGSHITGAALTSTTLKVTPDANNALLEALKIEVKPGTIGQVLTTTGTAGGEVATWATPNSLIVVDNGLNKDNSDVVELGGALKRVTEIEASATNTLAISGLQPATEEATNKVVVSEGATGILRTVERVVEGTDANVVNNSRYSFYTPEVVLNITLPATGDVTVQFPAPASAVGQVINIKIANKTESHTGYLNVLDTYGSMPYQGWIVKSNGSSWVIVGRN